MLGKTGATIYLSEILKAYYGFKHALIVCGINGAKYNWHMIEVPKFSYESSHIIGGRINKKGNFVVGDIRQRIEDLDADHNEFYLIINVESLRNEEILARLKAKIVSGEIGFVAIDEVHLVSGRTSEQGKAIQSLKPKFRVGLTGTPIHNRPLELYNLLVWLGYEHRNFEDFASEYTEKIPTLIQRGGSEIEFFKYIYKDLSLLHNRLKPIMLRRTADILKLPEPIFKDEYVELDKMQLKLYTKFKEDTLKENNFKSLLSVEQVVTNPGVIFMKARQVVSCPHIFGVTQDAKLERTIEIVQEALDDGKSLVIFAWFNETIDQYYRVLKDKFGDSILAVQSSTKNAQDIVSKFQNSDEPKVLIGTIGKLGTSFTITRADIVVFIDKHVIWSDYKQAYMRVWRQGQTKTVVIINIMAKDTVDERLEYLVGVGRSHSDQVVDGKTSNEYLDKVYGRLEELL